MSVGVERALPPAHLPQIAAMTPVLVDVQALAVVDMPVPASTRTERTTSAVSGENQPT
jgi:hypothetical protein